jgi:hypothetical protein
MPAMPAAESRTTGRSKRRQQCVGIGTDRIEGDIAKVEQAGETDDDVQPQASIT